MKNLLIYFYKQKKIIVVLNLKKGELQDPLNVTEDVSKIGRFGSGHYRISLKNEEYFEYTMELIKQSYRKNL